jgi:putative oxygen-independent coproporphyrinogen III oxidase
LTLSVAPAQLVPSDIPLALYIHMSWCVKKCPYCDFNSHAVPHGALSADLEQVYLQALVEDAAQQIHLAQGRSISSVFIGGGTPSLISATGYQWLFAQLKQSFVFNADCEITMEANPGTLEYAPFEQYLKAGINRLSLGVQTFQDQQLKILGRIHSANDAENAIQRALAAGFSRLNVDLMHGLPEQTLAQAMDDVQCAIDYGATHISWYQLTIEPNTVFFRTQPTLPDDDILADIQQAGEALLIQHGFKQYEVSAWAKELPSRHNVNYWQFGDYLAIGAGAHGKITQPDGIYRYQKTRLPKDYLAQVPAPMLNWQKIEAADLPFEFMMNALRLKAGVPAANYATRTGLDLAELDAIVQPLREQQLLVSDEQQLCCTDTGFNYLNDVLGHFVFE